MSGHFSNARLWLVASLLLLALAPAASAQSVMDSRRIEFSPSGAQAGLDVKTGTPLIQNYRLDIYRAGDTTVVQSLNLGNPAPDPDGMIRVDFYSLLPSPLPTGVIYDAVVNAIGPSDNTSSARIQYVRLQQRLHGHHFAHLVKLDVGSGGERKRGSHGGGRLRMESDQQLRVDHDYGWRIRHRQRHCRLHGCGKHGDRRRAPAR